MAWHFYVPGHLQLHWWLPSSLWYKTHLTWQLNCWPLRCSWSIACRHCSNYIFILHLTHGFNILRKDNWKPRRETFKFWDLVWLILEILTVSAVCTCISLVLGWTHWSLGEFNEIFNNVFKAIFSDEWLRYLSLAFIWMLCYWTLLIRSQQQFM